MKRYNKPILTIEESRTVIYFKTYDGGAAGAQSPACQKDGEETPADPASEDNTTDET